MCCGTWPGASGALSGDHLIGAMPDGVYRCAVWSPSCVVYSVLLVPVTCAVDVVVVGWFAQIEDLRDQLSSLQQECKEQSDNLAHAAGTPPPPPFHIIVPSNAYHPQVIQLL